MKLRRIEIENFRSFAPPIQVDIDDFTAFIGRNDIGKSSILAALTIFLEGESAKIDQDDGSLYGDPSSVRVTCEFDDLPQKIVLDDQFEATLTDECLFQENGRLRITKLYDCSKTKISSEIFINTYSHPVDSHSKSLLPLTIAELKKKAHEAGVQLEIGEATVKARIRRAISERSSALTRAAVDIPIGKNESQTLWNQLLKHLPMCALFISDRSSSDRDKEAQTPMGVAVEAALSAVQGDLDKLAEHVERYVQDVANRTLAKLQELNPALGNELKASIREKPKWKDLFKYSLTSDQGVPMDKRGSGVRRMVLLSFFRAEAERKALCEGGRPIIYAIEEPETSQHPEHQKMLVRALQDVANKGGQVLLTTHAPGLAGEMPIASLRFIDDVNGPRTVRSVATEESHQLFTDLAERLGMLPDNQVRVLICVEGVNDARFLRHVSHTLHISDPTLPDLSTDHRFVFIPMHGGNLRDIVNLHLFKNFRKPEFHIYDRDGGTGTYEKQQALVNERGDGSRAYQTKKRYMESYIYHDTIKRVTGVALTVNDNDDYTTTLCALIGKKRAEVKAILSDEVSPQMTVAEMDERDGQGEIRRWLQELAAMVNGGAR